MKPGSIVLFHNAALHTPEALPNILETLQKDGYKIVPISELIIKDNYTIDSTGMQIPNKVETSEPKPDVQKPAETEKKTKTPSQPTSTPSENSVCKII